MSIAMIGQRGVPATFGGVEHHVEELGSRLAAQGHQVDIYARPSYVTTPVTTHRGMNVRLVGTLNSKHMEAFVHSGVAAVDAIVRGYDIVHFHAIGPGFFSPLVRLSRRGKVVQTIHGLDQDRQKWGRLARLFLRSAAWMSGHAPHATVTVSHALADHYQEVYGCDAHYITNGVAAATPRPALRITEEWGLTPRSYLLYMGRLVPEKAPDLLMQAFSDIEGSDVRLVVAGGSSFTDDYVERLQRLAAADDRIIMPGYVYGELKDELYTNARAFVLPSYVEGLPLTLLEAISYCLPVVASDIAPHKEVMPISVPGRRLVPVGDRPGLVDALQTVIDRHDDEHLAAAAAKADTLAMYDWDMAASRLEELYQSLVKRGGPVQLGR